LGGGGFLGVEGRGGEEQEEDWGGETHGGIRVADFGREMEFVLPPVRKNAYGWGTRRGGGGSVVAPAASLRPAAARKGLRPGVMRPKAEALGYL